MKSIVRTFVGKPSVETEDKFPFTIFKSPLLRDTLEK